MIADSSSLDLEALTPSDVLVIGSGPVGIVLTQALESRGLKVLLIEAGSAAPSEQIQDDLKGQCTGSDLRGLTIGRTRQVGGGLNLWGGQLAVLPPEDIVRSANDLMKWPIGHEELYGSLDETLDLLGVPDIELGRNHRVIESETRHAEQYGLTIFQTAWLRQPKLSRQFWARLRRSSATMLIHDIVCTAIDVNRQSNRVSGVTAVCRSGRRVSLTASQTVLAAGTIENARLLMLPLPNGDPAPWRDSKWLGRGFNEHLDATTASIEIVDKNRMNNIFDPIVHRGHKYSPKIAWASSKRADHPISAYGILFWPGNVRNAISELIQIGKSIIYQRQARNVASLPKMLFLSAWQMLPLAYRYARQRRVGSFGDRNAYLRVSTEQPCRLESRLTLSPQERDRFGIPRPTINWLQGDEELRNLRDFTYAIKDWMEKESIAKVHVDPRLDRSDRAFLDAADDGLHHTGTTRMSVTPEAGVVDTDLRVHGIDGLSVCGASVFPSTGYANPTLTAMVLAVRLADRLARDVRSA